MTDTVRNISLYRLSRRAYLSVLNLTTTCGLQEKPIFVLGNQKAGTSAVAGLLAEMSGESVTIDIRGIYEPSLNKMFCREMSVKDLALKNKRDFASRIIKEPFLTFFYHCLVEHFPAAQFIFLVRDPVENIRSILNRAGYRHRYDPEKKPRLSPEWKAILSGAYISPCCWDALECLSLRWNITSSIYLDNQDRIRLCRYEDFVQDKQKCLQNLCMDLELPILHDLRHKLDFQYQQKGETGAGRQNFFSLPEIDKMESLCKPNMQSLGYG